MLLQVLQSSAHSRTYRAAFFFLGGGMGVALLFTEVKNIFLEGNGSSILASGIPSPFFPFSWPFVFDFVAGTSSSPLLLEEPYGLFLLPSSNLWVSFSFWYFNCFLFFAVTSFSHVTLLLIQLVVGTIIKVWFLNWMVSGID